MGLGSDFDPGEWTLVESVPNPWGEIPMTGGGRSLPPRLEKYAERLAATASSPDTVSRRHHYVPQAYLRAWSFDTKRVWTHDTVLGAVRPLGLRDVCVADDFHRVLGPGGDPHNRVELMFGVVDSELARLQRLFNSLEDPNDLEFDDLMALGVVIAVQRMRTLQERRLQLQYGAWLNAQNEEDFPGIKDTPESPYRVSGFHTQLLFESMWDAADVMTTRQIEVWTDEQGRFTTCDAPVLVTMSRGRRLDLLGAPHVMWPISPRRVVVLTNDPDASKAVMRAADAKHIGLVRRAVEQGRERMIFASESQRHTLAEGKRFRRRAQTYLTCSRRRPNGQWVDPPGCCVQWTQTLAQAPVVNLCGQGLHRPAPELNDLV